MEMKRLLKDLVGALKEYPDTLPTIKRTLQKYDHYINLYAGVWDLERSIGTNDINGNAEGSLAIKKKNGKLNLPSPNIPLPNIISDCHFTGEWEMINKSKGLKELELNFKAQLRTENFKEGDILQVQQLGGRDLRQVKVLAVSVNRNERSVLVNYIGYDDQFNEWLSMKDKRIRTRKTISEDVAIKIVFGKVFRDSEQHEMRGKVTIYMGTAFNRVQSQEESIGISLKDLKNIEYEIVARKHNQTYGSGMCEV